MPIPLHALPSVIPVVVLVGPDRYPSPQYFLFLCFFIEPQGASHGELNQPIPQFQADRSLSVNNSFAISLATVYNALAPLVSCAKCHPMTRRAMSGGPWLVERALPAADAAVLLDELLTVEPG